ncbi:MAG: DUF2853 family protein [Candidatus Woesearchaeota archaeon]|jgi:hypothetical protein|nr:DUF2853 family protein [Candidatus Woesearchaeota archaeon]
MTKRDEKIAFYNEELSKYTKKADEELLEAIVVYLGPSIYKNDAELVSTNDVKEVQTVKDSFLKKKLSLDGMNEEVLDKAILEVKDILGSSNKRKYRAIFYYFLVKKFELESVFITKIDEVEIKLEELTQIRTKYSRDNILPLLYLALFIDFLVIVILAYILF